MRRVIFCCVMILPQPMRNGATAAVFELQSYEKLKEAPRYLQGIAGENEKNRCPGGESGVEMRQRVLHAFAGVSARGDCLIVTHCGAVS